MVHRNVAPFRLAAVCIFIMNSQGIVYCFVEGGNGKFSGDLFKGQIPAGEGVTIPFRVIRRCGGAAVLHCLRIQHRAVMIHKSHRISLDLPLSGQLQILRGHRLRQLRLPAHKIIPLHFRIRGGDDRRIIILGQGRYFAAARAVKDDRILIDIPKGIEGMVSGCADAVGSGNLPSAHRFRGKPSGKSITLPGGYGQIPVGAVIGYAHPCRCGPLSAISIECYLVGVGSPPGIQSKRFRDPIFGKVPGMVQSLVFVPAVKSIALPGRGCGLRCSLPMPDLLLPNCTASIHIKRDQMGLVDCQG